MTIVTWDSIDTHTRNRVIKAARAWRMEHHKEILKMMVGICPPVQTPPTGSLVWDYTRWGAQQWYWFSVTIVLNIHKQERR